MEQNYEEGEKKREQMRWKRLVGGWERKERSPSGEKQWSITLNCLRYQPLDLESSAHLRQ